MSSANKLTNWFYDVTLTSHYVIVTNKLYLDDRNNEYIVLCKFGSHTISGCRVTGVGPPKRPLPPPPPPGPGKQKRPGLNRVKGIILVSHRATSSVRDSWPFMGVCGWPDTSNNYRSQFRTKAKIRHCKYSVNTLWTNYDGKWCD